jgi:hypothetical protein
VVKPFNVQNDVERYGWNATRVIFAAGQKLVPASIFIVNADVVVLSVVLVFVSVFIGSGFVDHCCVT